MALGGDAAFWLLAAAAYGAFGVGEPGAVVISVGGGEAHVVPVPPGGLRLSLGAVAPGETVVVRSSPAPDARGAAPMLRLEGRYTRPPEDREGSALRAQVDGDVGAESATAALEVVVANEGPSVVPRPVVLVALPAAAELPAEALEAMERASGVAAVEPPDGRGVVRVDLAPLEPGARARVPFPLVWLAAGSTRGLAVASFPAERSWDLSVTPERSLTIERVAFER
jgi:hypothetical protein